MRDFKQKFLELADKAQKEKSFIVPTDLTGEFSLGRDDEEGWWDKIVDQSRFVKDIGVRFTDGDTVYRNELTLGSAGEDIYLPGVPGADPGDTVTAGDDQRSVHPEEVVAIVPWTQGMSESIKDGEAAYNHFLDLVAKAEANSLEKAILHGVKAGSNNSKRGTIYGCFDGVLEQIRSLGHIVEATDSGFDNRNIDISAGSNDKFMSGAQTLPTKYDDGTNVWFTDPGVRRLIAGALEDRGFNIKDEFLRQGVYGSNILIHGIPTYPIPLLRTNFKVQGTGVMAGGASQVNGDGVAKGKAASITVDSTTNFVNTDTGVIGALSASTAYGINAENFIVSGAPNGTVIVPSANLLYDHADNEYVNEYTTAPTADGRYALLGKLENLRLVVRRGMQIEVFKEPRKRAWSLVISRKLAPFVLNPDAFVLLRDLKATL